tara:strand:+ start:1173 stop:1532 length:360 start_codon:yes stop_codon:yes gene_type:complete
MYFEEGEINEDNEDNERGEYTQDILNEMELDFKIEIINNYKELLIKDPDFIGINNLSNIKLLNIIEDINNNKILRFKKEHYVTPEQFNIFINMYNELNINYNTNIIQNVINKIFSIIYV